MKTFVTRTVVDYQVEALKLKLKLKVKKNSNA